MILHVAGLDKFIPPFVNLIKEEFGERNHQFWLTGSVEKYPVELSDSVYICGSGFWNKICAYAKLIRQLHAAQKVMLHGLFNIRLVVLLALCPWLLPKCHWIIWGGDLYSYQLANRDWKWKVKEFFRRSVIKNIGHLVTYIEGDVALARKWYGAKGIYQECLMYLSNVVNPNTICLSHQQHNKSGLNILLGNSADPSNNHIEAMERLLPYKDRNIKIFVPLSYGDQIHAEAVIRQGSEWFGDKFVPMAELMPFNQYLDFLKSLDIAIFNHQRQQAMGNTITLLGMGKTVFMRSDVSHWRFLNSFGINMGNVADLTLQPIGHELLQENSQIVQSYFSKETLIKQLSNIFEGSDGLSD